MARLVRVDFAARRRLREGEAAFNASWLEGQYVIKRVAEAMLALSWAAVVAGGAMLATGGDGGTLLAAGVIGTLPALVLKYSEEGG